MKIFMIFGAELIVYILPKHIENFFIKFYFNKSQLFLVGIAVMLFSFFFYQREYALYVCIYLYIQNAWQSF